MAKVISIYLELFGLEKIGLLKNFIKEFLNILEMFL